MKKIIVIFISVLLCFSMFVESLCASMSYSGITSSKTPIENASLKYQLKLGDGYKNSPTTPVYHNGFLIVYSGGKLIKLNAKNGDTVKTVSTVSANTYTTVVPTVADGKIFVQLNNGTIQAFDFDSMKSLWVYKDAIGGQSLTDIVYSGGYIYTGFWKSETDYANFVCISAKDENTSKTDESKKAKWTYKSKGGFYNSSPCVISDYVIVGKDNGLDDSTSSSKILCLKKSDGKLASSLTVSGDIRSGVYYNSSSKTYFVSSKAGYVYSFKVDGTSGKFSSKKTLKLSGPATATPIVYENRLYIGSSDGKGKGKFYVINASNLTEIFHIDTEGYPQSSALVSNGYESSGKIYVYFTVNAKPGKIYMLVDTSNAKTSYIADLFTPDSTHSQYCISRISVSEDGTLFYKNDSATIFAVSQKSQVVSNPIIIFINRLLQALKNIFGI